MSEEKRLEAVAFSLRQIEDLAARLRDLIASQPPLDLLGYIYGNRLLETFRAIDGDREQGADSEGQRDYINDTQFVLEYVHAAFASTPERDDLEFNEGTCAEIYGCAANLRTATMVHAMMTSGGTRDGAFGPDTADIEFRAKADWILIRGNRYPVLEGEFYAFVLAPHDDLLRATYGTGAAEIAAGFQDVANSIRTGHSDAVEEIERKMDAAHAFAEARGVPIEEALETWATLILMS
jgi:hypothetical protein